MVLANCLASAWRNEPQAALDAGSSMSALRDWTYYDLEKAPAAIKNLIESYLARNFHNPLVDSEVKDVRFDLLKCLDLYHSGELDKQADQLIISPGHTWRQDNP